MRRNRASENLLIILISLIVISCRSQIASRSTATYVGPTSVPIYLNPLTASWRLADESLIQQESSTIAIQAIYLNGQQTILFLTLSGIGFEEFTPGIPIQITDEVEYSSKLLKVIPLGTVDNLSVGIMVFEPRRVGAQKLILQWPIFDNGETSERTVAIFSGGASEDITDRTYYGSHAGSVKQDGYLISVRWGGNRGDQKDELPEEIEVIGIPISGAQPTSTPAILQPLDELASGVYVLQECSLVIENTEKDQIKTINIQLLTNANVVIESEGVVSVPEPIIINEPVSTPIPSAYP